MNNPRGSFLWSILKSLQFGEDVPEEYVSILYDSLRNDSRSSFPEKLAINPIEAFLTFRSWINESLKEQGSDEARLSISKTTQISCCIEQILTLVQTDTATYSSL